MSHPEWEEGFSFEILAQDPHSHARLGRLTTPHGVIYTPAFMPVGTYGAVKGIAPTELVEAGAQIILANALHLEFRPGAEVVARLGGLHQLMGWRGPILTDSGGFQTFSLTSLSKLKGDGMDIRSPVEGTTHRITPESLIAIQRQLGTDFMMPLDLCAAGDSDYRTFEQALRLTQDWAVRSQQAFQQSEPQHGNPQALFGIAQGGTHEVLRQQAMAHLIELDFFGYAIGGLAVGESSADRWQIVEVCQQRLPANKPRYLMGVGTPDDLQQAISLGMDLFDCVLPTRNGRKGSLFTTTGKMNLRNASFREDTRPLEAGCTCLACRPQLDGRPTFSRGAIRHLLTCRDPLGARLGAGHNLTFYLRLMTRARQNLTPRVGGLPEISDSILAAASSAPGLITKQE